MFKLEILTADTGDCFLVHYGDKNKPKLMLFDGGPKTTWEKALKPRLSQLKSQLSPNAPLPLELVVITHIDDDHIHGIIDLTNELVATSPSSRLVDIKGRWFNSFTDLSEAMPAARRQGLAALASENQWAVFASANFLQDPATKMILASIDQGDSLTNNFVKLNLRENRAFPSHVNGYNKVDDFNQLPTMHVIGPLEQQLEDLKNKWNPSWTEAQVAAYVDQSVPNLSSIAVLIEYDGKRILMTGDARGDHILKGLKKGKLLEADAPIHVNVLKLPHHGSNRNVSKTFFQKVTADIYVVSADGTHDNPDYDTLEWLVRSRADDDTYEIYFSNKMKTNVLQKELLSCLKRLKKDRLFEYTFGPDDEGGLSLTIDMS